MVQLEISTIIFRLLLAFLLSTRFGLERQFKKKPVGFGTFTFVATGSCVLTLLAFTLSDGTNPFVFIGAIMTGVGFLGAGALIRQDRKVHGSTTAAGIWAFAALGVTIGSGLIYLALIFYAFIITIVLIDTFFEKHSFGHYSKYLLITIEDIDAFSSVKNTLPKNSMVQSFNFDMMKPEYTFSFVLNAKSEELSKIPSKLMKIKQVKSFKMD